MAAMQPAVRNSLLLLSRTPQSTSYQRLLPPAAASLSSPQCQSRRPFSHSPGRRAAMGTSQAIKPKVPAQMSMRSRLKDMTASELPGDMGLLPGTFVRPTGDNMPSIFQEPRARLQMEWTSLKINVQNFIGILSYCKYLNKRLPLRLRERKHAALDLHKKMYQAFAEGDEANLGKITCEGLYEDFSRRMSSRSSPTLIWTLHKYYRSLPTFSKAQVVSDRAGPLPGLPNSGIRQVVVRIRSRQSIVKPSQDGEGEVPEAKQKDCVENVVIQRILWNGNDQDWKVWGMAEETTVEDLESPFFAGGLSVADRLTMLRDQFQAKK